MTVNRAIDPGDVGDIGDVLDATRFLLDLDIEPPSALQRLCRLLVPSFADLVQVAVSEGQMVDRGPFEIQASAHVNPERAELHRQLRGHYRAVRAEDNEALASLIRGELVFRPEVDEDFSFDLSGLDEDARELLRAVLPRSTIVVPLKGRETVFGVISFSLTDDSGRQFDEADLAIAVEIARRVAALVDSARLRDELQRSVALLDTMLQSAPEAFAFFDRDLVFRRINDAMAEAQGHAVEDTIGRTVEDIVPDIAPGLRRVLQHVLDTGTEVVGRELRRELPWRPGVFAHYIGSFYPVRVDDGAIVGVACLMRDISDRVRAEQSRLTLEAELEQARRMQAIGQLAGGVAHDFNNLLAVVRLRSQLLRRARPEDSQLVDALLVVERAVDQGAALAERLLRFSSDSSDGPEPIEVDAVLTGLWPLLTATVGDRVTLRVETLSDSRVALELGGFEQIVLNLVLNARDAIEGAGVVTVTTRALDDPDVVELAVADTGVGMDEATRLRACEPFFTTKPPGVGAGLGLATVAGTVRSAGGTIELDSTAGVGTTVRVRLPRLAVAPALAEASRVVGSASAHGETILIVDDEVEVGRAVAAALEGVGYRTLLALDPERALALTASAGPSVALLVTDVVMPGLSGVDLATRMRERRPDLPVVFMTGHAEQPRNIEALLGSGERLLRKPFTLAELVDRVGDALAATTGDAADDPAKLHS